MLRKSGKIRRNTLLFWFCMPAKKFESQNWERNIYNSYDIWPSNNIYDIKISFSHILFLLTYKLKKDFILGFPYLIAFLVPSINSSYVDWAVQ